MADYISSHSGSQIDGAVDTVLNIQQTTGENTGYLMSQKAITDAITAAQPEIVQTTGTSETAIMSQKAVTNMYNSDIVIGGNANNGGADTCIAIGKNVSALVNNTTVVGSDSTADKAYVSAFGSDVNVTGLGSVAVGYNADVSGAYAVSVGHNSSVSGQDSVAIGVNANSTSGSGIALGARSTVTQTRGIAIGDTANSGDVDSIAVGGDTSSSGSGSIVIGQGSSATLPYGIAIGKTAQVSKLSGIAIGDTANVSVQYGVALGSEAECTETKTVSVGGGSIPTRRIVNVADPTNPQDVATKNYIDNLILTNALNIYVNAASGNDSNAGTEEAPYATLTKAISVIPKLIQSAATINVAAGSYEFPNIFGFSGYGSLTIIGAGDTTIYTNAINIGYNSLSYIQIANAQFQYTPQSSEPDKLYNNVGIIDLSGLKFIGTAETPLTSPLRISASNNVLVTNCTFNYFDTAILAISATRCIVTTLTCNNGTYAIGSYNGAIVSLVNTISGATTNVTNNSTGGAVIYPNGTFTP